MRPSWAALAALTGGAEGRGVAVATLGVATLPMVMMDQKAEANRRARRKALRSR